MQRARGTRTGPAGEISLHTSYSWIDRGLIVRRDGKEAAGDTDAVLSSLLSSNANNTHESTIFIQVIIVILHKTVFMIRSYRRKSIIHRFTAIIIIIYSHSSSLLDGFTANAPPPFSVSPNYCSHPGEMMSHSILSFFRRCSEFPRMHPRQAAFSAPKCVMRGLLPSVE